MNKKGIRKKEEKEEFSLQHKFFILLWVICHSFHMIFINSFFFLSSFAESKKDESDFYAEETNEKLRFFFSILCFFLHMYKLFLSL